MTAVLTQADVPGEGLVRPLAEQGGTATLRHRTSPLHWLVIALQVALWVAAILCKPVHRWFIERTNGRPRLAAGRCVTHSAAHRGSECYSQPDR